MHDETTIHPRVRASRATPVGVIICVIALVGLASPASAGRGHHRSIHASGVAVPAEAGQCAEDFAIVLGGSLDGCLNIIPDSFECVESPDGKAPDVGVEKGTEIFVGTVDLGHGHHKQRRHHRHDNDNHTREGTFATTYVFEATFAPGSGCDFGQQLAGGCVHYITHVSGTGGLAGIGGVIVFVDNIPDPPGGAVDFSYTARLDLRHRRG